LHHEYSFSYWLDITEVFFTPKLATERKRVADQAQAQEHVLIPFAGIGPYAIPVASRGGIVIAIEINPSASRYFRKNVAANGIASAITIIEGDAFKKIPLFPAGAFDRAIIPTPYGQDRILDLVIPHIKTSGTIHMYTFRKSFEIPSLIAEYRLKGLSVKTIRRCGNIAPGVSRWVFDLCKDA